MKHCKYLAIPLLLFITLITSAQSKVSRREYIETYKDMAIREMHRSGIPASITMAQACLESDNGNSELAQNANNHFGIKCKSDWKGARSFHNDDKLNECFRKYRNIEESYDDHTNYLMQNQRYAYLFKISNKDFDAWAKGLKAAGYATDPEYANRLIKIINEEQLHLLDLVKPEDLPQRNLLTEKAKKTDTESARKKVKGSFDDISIDPYSRRDVKTLNGLDIIYVKQGDTYESIAIEFDMKEWEIRVYNDLTKDTPQPKVNDFLYLQRKRFVAQKGNETHTLMPKESMWQISQKYGIKLNRLYKLNRMKNSDRPVVGDPLYLRKKRNK